MQKLNHMSINDILKRRKAKVLVKNTKKDIVQMNPNNFQEQDQNLVDDLLERIKKLPSLTPMKCELNTEEKNCLLDFLSEKENISYNKNVLNSLLSVWKYPDHHELDLHQQSFMTGNLKQSTSNSHKHRKSYYVLSGKIAFFQTLSSSSSFEPKKKGRATFNEFQKKNKNKISYKSDIENSQLLQCQPIRIIQQFSGYGPIFKSKDQHKSTVSIAMDAIVIEIRHPQFQHMIFNNGGMEPQKKLEIIEHFKIFDCTGRKIQNIMPSIEFKKYTRNQCIYKAGQDPTAFYLIVKGEIIFDMKLDLPLRKKSVPVKLTDTPKNANNQGLSLQTETLGMGNYFGEEQILYEKSQRILTAICHSSQCSLLEIPIQKFQKLLGDSDFYELMKKGVDQKMDQRKLKIGKAMNVFKKFQRDMEDRQLQSINSENDKIQQNGPKSPKKKKNQVKIMHGNVIRKIPNLRSEEDVNFSMLQANPDMYQATLKKFRKLTAKPTPKQKPEVNWKLKRVWKVLNLQNVLRDDGQIGSPEGKKYFQSHRRFRNHVSQVKSLRPKTSSSTYRTKLQYIAYLQQFNT